MFNRSEVPVSCLFNNVESNIQPSIVEYNEKTWKILFPPHSNLKNLKMTNIGLYSIAKPTISKALIDFIEELRTIFGEKPLTELSITESHGGLGGFSIQLFKKFKLHNIVESDKTHSEILKHNINVYADEKYPDSVKIYNDDYLNILYNLNNDIIVSDPPWTDKYHTQKILKLTIDNIDITYVINQLYAKKKFKMFILMAPKTFDISSFIKYIYSPDIHIKKVNKHYLIAILRKY